MDIGQKKENLRFFWESTKMQAETGVQSDYRITTTRGFDFSYRAAL
jgi:hypothetical protein